jgi:hypothetical protein
MTGYSLELRGYSSDEDFMFFRQPPNWMVGAPLPRCPTVQQHRRYHQIRALPFDSST